MTDKVWAAISGSTSLRSPEPVPVSALPGNDPGRECEECAEGYYPQYGVAPHECFWRKGPEFTIGQSTLVAFDEHSCFVPDLNADEDWSAFGYPSACGVYYCPRCHVSEYRAAWSALINRIGPPPAEVATCNHGDHDGN